MTYETLRRRADRPPLPPLDVMLFAPVARDLRQCLGAEGKPSRLHSAPPKRVLEIAERTGAVDRVQQLLANPVGLHRVREFPHDLPLVYIELGGKSHEAVTRSNPFGEFPFRHLPVRKVRLVVVVVGLFSLAQKLS